jgi:Protein of unknown function (DUF4058)
MTVHDWSPMPDKSFHDFHQTWIVDLKGRLNERVLPKGYHARVEQHVGGTIPDVLALELPDRPRPPGAADRDFGRAVAVADAPPRVMIDTVMTPRSVRRRRTIAVRQSDDERLVAVVEVVSAGNKDRPDAVAAFVGKLGTLLRSGVHVVVLDLLPPTRHTPGGLHPAVADDLRVAAADADAQPPDRPIAFLAYAARDPQIGVYINYLRVGDRIPDMPLFLTPERYVNLPLAAAYKKSFRELAEPDQFLLTAGPAAG